MNPRTSLANGRCPAGQISPLVIAMLMAVTGPLFCQAPPPADGRAAVNAGTASAQQLYAPAVQDEFTFVIYGDRTSGERSGLPVLQQAVRMTNRLAPTFVMTVGDLIQGYNRAPEWLLQAAEYRGIVDALTMPWYPVAGNHDVYARPERPGGNTDLYQRVFGPLYYAFDYRWAHFLVLYSDEQLAFHDPARNQNMSPEQLGWLRQDLATTRATQIYVFLHHPRWTYEGCNWPEVHEMLVADGRVQAVFAGHIHQYRDDGLRDGIHYYTLATTGGSRGALRETSSIDHLDHIRVTPTGFSLCVLPITNSVYAGDFVTGAEVDAMHAVRLADCVHITMPARQSLTDGADSVATVRIENPAACALHYEVRLDMPTGWQLSSEVTATSGRLAGGESTLLDLPLRAPALGGTRPGRPEITVIYRYPLASGIEQPLHHKITIPLDLEGLGELARTRADSDHALELDGRSALRVDLPHQPPAQLTIEAWVKGAAPTGRQGLLARTESSAYGIFWSEKGRETPAAYLYIEGHGYLAARVTKPWTWQQWTHVAASYDGTTLRLFVAGQPVASASQAGNITGNQLPFYIGADTDHRGRAVSYFRGSLDEIRISQVARYTAPFTPARRHESDADTLLLLHCDRPELGVFPDASPHGHHAWPVGRPRLLPHE